MNEIEIKILYEDLDTLVIYKPVNVVVNRAESVAGETVAEWAEKNTVIGEKVLALKQQENLNYWEKTFVQRSGVCHRLDKETSGCLILAKNPEALAYYLDLFKKRKVKKIYTALVHGKVMPTEGEVVLPIKRSVFDREKWQVHYEGKRADTLWKVVSYHDYAGPERYQNTLTLLKLNLKTGRTHQIRVHLSFLGWPIFADEKYLSSEVSKEDRKKLSHHFLHAGYLEFKNTKKEVVKVEALLPDDALELLRLL